MVAPQESVENRSGNTRHAAAEGRGPNQKLSADAMHSSVSESTTQGESQKKAGHLPTPTSPFGSEASDVSSNSERCSRVTRPSVNSKDSARSIMLTVQRRLSHCSALGDEFKSQHTQRTRQVSHPSSVTSTVSRVGSLTGDAVFEADPPIRWKCQTVLGGMVCSMLTMTLVCCGTMIVLMEVVVGKLQLTLAEAGVVCSGAAAANPPPELATALGVSAQVAALESEAQAIVAHARIFAAVICVVLAMAGVAIGFSLGTAVSLPMQNVSRLMRGMGTLKLDSMSSELAFAESGGRSCFLDVCTMQEAVCRLSRSIEMFAKFLPEPVVRRIVGGEERAYRLHVSKRQVTVMFSDIKDFTKMAETMPQEDLVFLLTRYFDIMTGIVQSYEGVVSEILGDGLLVFWNAPDDVEDHAAKACAAAIAQQQVLGPLNEELVSLGFSPIGIRIGIHTGTVLAGNIGSQTKMKFGCIGDGVNLASRIEGLCKFYGVTVMCTGAVHQAVDESAGIFFRTLDLVQVKGKHDATEVFEVIGFREDVCSTGARTPSKSPLPGASMGSSEEASPLRLGTFSGGVRSLSSSLHGRMRRVMKVAMSDDAPCSRTSPQADRRYSLGSSGSQEASGVSHNLGVVSREACRHTKMYEEALRAYREAQFAMCQELLEALLQQQPDNNAASLLLERCIPYVSEFPLSASQRQSWTGVRVMTDK